MTVNQISSYFKINKETLRYYETINLLNPHRNPQNGYRMYSENDKTRLDFILRLKKFGFSLNEIKTFFELVNKSKNDKKDLNVFLHKKISNINNQIDGLNNLKESLVKFETKEDVESCNVLSKLILSS